MVFCLTLGDFLQGLAPPGALARSPHAAQNEGGGSQHQSAPSAQASAPWPFLSLGAAFWGR